MTAHSGTHSPAPKQWTWLGLTVALFAIPVLAWVFRLVFGTVPSGAVLLRELLIFSCALLVLWILTTGERLPLVSIGIEPLPMTRLAGWTLVTLVACILALAAGLLCVQMFDLRFGSAPATTSIEHPLWLIFLVVLRAGIVEEIFYRGYAIRRLRAVSGSRIISIVLPLLIFAGFHYTQGAGGVLVSLLLGGVLTAIYLWQRNLLIVMAAHFLVDFLPNVLIPLLAGE